MKTVNTCAKEMRLNSRLNTCAKGGTISYHASPQVTPETGQRPLVRLAVELVVPWTDRLGSVGGAPLSSIGRAAHDTLG